MKFFEERSVVFWSFFIISVTYANSDTRIEINCLIGTDGSYSELNWLKDVEEGKLIKHFTKNFITNCFAITEGIFGVFVRDHNVDRQISWFNLSQFMID